LQETMWGSGKEKAQGKATWAPIRDNGPVDKRAKTCRQDGGGERGVDHSLLRGGEMEAHDEG
jgi:hypothetical protein